MSRRRNYRDSPRHNDRITYSEKKRRTNRMENLLQAMDEERNKAYGTPIGKNTNQGPRNPPRTNPPNHNNDTTPHFESRRHESRRSRGDSSNHRSYPNEEFEGRHPNQMSRSPPRVPSDQFDKAKPHFESRQHEPSRFRRGSRGASNQRGSPSKEFEGRPFRGGPRSLERDFHGRNRSPFRGRGSSRDRARPSRSRFHDRSRSRSPLNNQRHRDFPGRNRHIAGPRNARRSRSMSLERRKITRKRIDFKNRRGSHSRDLNRRSVSRDREPYFDQTSVENQNYRSPSPYRDDFCERSYLRDRSISPGSPRKSFTDFERPFSQVDSPQKPKFSPEDERSYLRERRDSPGTPPSPPVISDMRYSSPDPVDPESFPIGPYSSIERNVIDKKYFQGSDSYVPDRNELRAHSNDLRISRNENSTYHRKLSNSPCASLEGGKSPSPARNLTYASENSPFASQNSPHASRDSRFASTNSFVPQNSPYEVRNSFYTPQKSPNSSRNSPYRSHTSSYASQIPKASQISPHGGRSSDFIPQSSPYSTRSSPYASKNSSYLSQNSSYTPQKPTLASRNAPFASQKSTLVSEKSPYTSGTSFASRTSPLASQESPLASRKSPFAFQKSTSASEKFPYTSGTSFASQETPNPPQNFSYAPQKPTFASQNSPFASQKSTLASENSPYTSGTSFAYRKSPNPPQNSSYTPQKPTLASRNSPFAPQKSTLASEKSLYTSGTSFASQKSSYTPEKPTLAPRNSPNPPQISSYGSQKSSRSPQNCTITSTSRMYQFDRQDGHLFVSKGSEYFLYAPDSPQNSPIENPDSFLHNDDINQSLDNISSETEMDLNSDSEMSKSIQVENPFDTTDVPVENEVEQKVEVKEVDKIGENRSGRRVRDQEWWSSTLSKKRKEVNHKRRVWFRSRKKKNLSEAERFKIKVDFTVARSAFKRAIDEAKLNHKLLTATTTEIEATESTNQILKPRTESSDETEKGGIPKTTPTEDSNKKSESKMEVDTTSVESSERGIPKILEKIIEKSPSKMDTSVKKVETEIPKTSANILTQNDTSNKTSDLKTEISVQKEKGEIFQRDGSSKNSENSETFKMTSKGSETNAIPTAITSVETGIPQTLQQETSLNSSPINGSSKNSKNVISGTLETTSKISETLKTATATTTAETISKSSETLKTATVTTTAETTSKISETLKTATATTTAETISKSPEVLKTTTTTAETTSKSSETLKTATTTAEMTLKSSETLKTATATTTATTLVKSEIPQKLEPKTVQNSQPKATSSSKNSETTSKKPKKVKVPKRIRRMERKKKLYNNLSEEYGDDVFSQPETFDTLLGSLNRGDKNVLKRDTETFFRSFVEKCENPITVPIVLNRFPVTKLNRTIGALVKKYLMSKIEDEMSRKPKFSSVKLNATGVLLVDCCDSQSADWLRNVIFSSPPIGQNNLIITNLNEVSMLKVSTVVPGRPIPMTEFLATVAYQNPNVQTKRWRIISEKSVTRTRRQYFIEMSQKCWNEIVMRNCRLFYMHGEIEFDVCKRLTQF